MKCFLLVPVSIVVIEASASWPGCSKTPWGDQSHLGDFVVFEGEKEKAPTRVIGEMFNFTCRYCGQSGGTRRATSSGQGSPWQRVDTGEIRRRIGDFGTGAMWFADWYKRDEVPQGGRALYGWDWDNQFEPPLMVTTPGGDWNIDSRASNCTMPNDRLHRCWIRHGEPPNVTVDKNGVTCSAGGGSIMSGNYHGFLRNGEFTPNC